MVLASPWRFLPYAQSRSCQPPSHEVASRARAQVVPPSCDSHTPALALVTSLWTSMVRTTPGRPPGTKTAPVRFAFCTQVVPPSALLYMNPLQPPGVA